METDLQPIGETRSFTHVVYRRLVDAIATGVLPPGERLTQQSLAARLAVSRQPISHALHRLKASGLATEAGRRGLVVAPIDPSRLKELYQLRAAIEGLATRLAAEQALASGARDKALRALNQALASGQRLTGADAILDWIRADIAFHDAIYRLSGSTVILETVEPLWPHFMRSMGSVLTSPQRRDDTWREHLAIAEAISRGRAEAAEQAARFHVEQASAAMMQTLESGKEWRGPR